MPRFLRWRGNLALQELTREELLALIGGIWTGKAEWERKQRSPISLQAFLFQKFWGSGEQGHPKASVAGTESAGQADGMTMRMGSMSSLSSHHARAAQVLTYK